MRTDGWISFSKEKKSHMQQKNYEKLTNRILSFVATQKVSYFFH